MSFDLQIAGVIDDGTDGGASKAVLARMDLVPLPFRAGMIVSSDLQGSTSISTNGNGASNISNPDQTGCGLFFSVASGTPASPQGGRIRFLFSGTIFGLRWSRAVSAALDFDAIIDGVSYPIRNSAVYPDNQSTNFQANDAGEVIAEGLPKGEHCCDLVFTYGSVTCTYNLHGLAVDRSNCFRIHDQSFAPNVTTLTTSNALIATSSYRAVRKVIYTNLNQGKVTVGSGGAAQSATTLPVVALTGALPSGSVLVFPGGLIAITTASAAAAATSLTVAALAAAIPGGIVSGYPQGAATVLVTVGNGNGPLWIINLDGGASDVFDPGALTASDYVAANPMALVHKASAGSLVTATSIIGYI